LTGGRKAVFLDRDGTLIDLVPYLHDPAQVRLISGAATALRRLGESGWTRILVTNQSGVARGYYGLEEVARVHERLLDLLRASGADLEAIEICPHHPDFGSPCDCRKPAPGMIARAAARLGIAPRDSWVVGDRWEDIATGSPLGCRGILVMTGHGREQIAGGTDPRLVATTEIVSDIAAAADRILAVEMSDGA
jgi:D-glycero-D-manno-heptose 1,7-bisphosphate phosphatase